MASREKISFATFNMYNINLPGLPMYSNSTPWTERKYKKKLTWSAEVLKNFDSDVLGFQELWHNEALKDVFKKAKLLDKYDLIIPKNHNGAKIVCAGAVKKGLLVGRAKWIENFPEKFILESKKSGDPQAKDMLISIKTFSRPVLNFKIKTESSDKPISVYVVHFKSKGPTKIYKEKWFKEDAEYYKPHSSAIGSALSTIRRTTEATALRMIITEDKANNSNPVIVLGDCNDGQLSNTLNILTEQPNYLLSGYSKGGSAKALYTVGTLQEYRSLRDVYYTHIYKNTKESLDHILVSQ